MPHKTFDRLLLISLFFMTQWFFGNVYEEIVMVPNHLGDTYKTLTGYVTYFHTSNPVFYFVPFTQLAVLVVIFLYFKCDDPIPKNLLKKASVYGILAIILTAVIVTQINIKIFSANFGDYKDQLYTLSVFWLIGNALRIFLVGTSIYYAGKVYILRQILFSKQHS